LHNLLTTRRGRLGLLLTASFLIGAVAVGGRIYGQHLAHQDMLDRDRAMHQLEAESQKLERQSAEQAGVVAALQARLTQAQEKLDTVLPSKDTYSIDPNKSVVAADGRLTFGLVGPPTSNRVTINVNGKQYTVAAGEVIHVADDASAPCKVAVQSFDMFNATVTASCSEPKTH
jgi:cell division protein ZapA (FtsZ GTPase activity inhibitor)